MALTAATILGHAREIYGDTDTVNPGVSDTILLEMLNPIVAVLWRMNPRPVWRSATTMGWTGITANSKSATSTVTDIIEVQDGPGLMGGPAIIGAFLEASSSSTAGTPLRRMRPARIIQLQNSDSTTGTPVRYSVERAATQTEADSGKVIIRLHPIPSATTEISARVIPEPETIDGTTDGVDLDNDSGYGAAALLAWMAAPLARQPIARIEEIRKQVPAIYMAAWLQPMPVQRIGGEA